MKDTTIVVASRGRHTLKKGTLQALTDSGIDPVIVVPSGEEDLYMEAWPRAIVMGHAEDGLSSVHQCILEWCDTKKLILMDDDLRFAYRADPKMPPLTAMDDIRPAIDWIATELSGVAHAGISARQGNNRLEPGLKMAGPMRSIMGLRVDIMCKHGVRMDRTVSKNDYDTTLQLLRLGYIASINPLFTHDQSGGPYLAGGNTGIRDDTVHINASHQLASLHKGFVKVVEKTPKNWDGGELSKRTDVVCYWKKALESGMESNPTRTVTG